MNSGWALVEPVEFYSLKVNQWTGGLETHEENLLKIKQNKINKQNNNEACPIRIELISCSKKILSFQVYTRMYGKTSQSLIKGERKN